MAWPTRHCDWCVPREPARRLPGHLGAQDGMGQLPLARLPSGKSIAFPAAVQWLSAIAWDGLVGLFGAEGAQALFHIPFVLGVLMVLALEGLIGFMGYEVIHQLEKRGSAILAILFVVLSLRVLQYGHIPFHDTVHGGATVGAFVWTSTIAFGGAFSWASCAADYSRYQDKDMPSSGPSGAFAFRTSGPTRSVWLVRKCSATKRRRACGGS